MKAGIVEVCRAVHSYMFCFWTFGKFFWESMLELKSVQSVPSGGDVNIFNISTAALLSDVKCMNPVHFEGSRGRAPPLLQCADRTEQEVFVLTCTWTLKWTGTSF